MRLLSLVAVFLLAISGPLAQAQEEPAAEGDITMNVARGLTAERPFTVIYPETMQLVEDGDDVTVATLEYSGAPFQCDALIVDGGAPDWAADTAAANLDRAATEADWTTDFPGFAIAQLGTTEFQSGPALYYEGLSQSSPFGFPATIFHAETVDSGRIYVFECLADSTIAAEARTLVAFLLANFSTRADGECCAAPAATLPE